MICLEPHATPEPSRSTLERTRRAALTIRKKGVNYYAQNYGYKMLRDYFNYQRGRVRIVKPLWREINFKALELKGSAKLLLNPADMGFSREFSIYGFREPLNTYAIFNKIARTKPAVLDIGGNLGYFPLLEREAGAKKIVVLEPVPQTFSFLSKTLSDQEEFEYMNMAISDGEDYLSLFSTDQRNMTSFSKSILATHGHVVSEEILAKAISLEDAAVKYPISMIRMDIEGYEYRVLGKKLPDQIKMICMEFHVIPPGTPTKPQAIEFLQKLKEQGFEVTVAINEMIYGYYPIIQHAGLKTAYKLVTRFNSLSRYCPRVEVNPSLNELSNLIPEKGQVHLILER